VYGEPKKAEPINVAAMKDEELVTCLESKNNWWPRMASLKTLERIRSLVIDDNGDFDAVARSSNILLNLAGNSNKPLFESVRLALALGELTMVNQLQARLKSFSALESESLRVLSYRSLLPQVDINYDAKELFDANHAEVLAQFLKAAQSDKSGLVRLHLASALQRLPLNSRWPIATALAKHEEDANDRQQPLMIWYGIEPVVAAEPMKGVELIREAKIPTVRRLVARRIAEMIEEKPEAVDALVALMTEHRNVRDDVLSGMAAGLDGFSSAKKPKGWDEVSKSIEASCSDEFKEIVRNLSVVFGSGRAADELIAIVKNADGDANARLNAFKSLTRTTKPELLAVIRAQVNDKVLGTVSRNALAAYDDPSIPKQLLGSWPVRSEEQQAATVATLTLRASYAKELLEAVKAKKVPAAAISPFQARQIRSLNDEALTKLLTEAWGEIRDTPEAKKAEFAKWEGILKPETLAKADKSKGRMIFTAACSACHKMYGQGGAIGPELTGSDRRNLKYLLENILDPSAVVPADFRVSIFHLKDGRTISGVMPEQTERTITVQTPAERLVIERTQIVKQEQLTMSLMPEGLLTALGEENVINLIAYLMGEGQVEMPK
jgi:putative heme-binding domain-containing protein